jgi:hypothetical protein
VSKFTLALVITPVQDGINEGDETVIFTLVEYSTYTLRVLPIVVLKNM